MCSSLRNGYTQWLWATFCIAYTFQLRALIRSAAKQLVVEDVHCDAASTPLASAFALMSTMPSVGGATTAEPGAGTAIGAAVEGAAVGSAAEGEAGMLAGPVAGTASAAAETADIGAAAAAGGAVLETFPGVLLLLELMRQGVGEICLLNACSIPEVLLVVIIMRMDQLAGGRPQTKKGGTSLGMDGIIVSGDRRRHLTDSHDGSVDSSSSSSSSSSEVDSYEWPEVLMSCCCHYCSKSNGEACRRLSS